MKLSDWLDEYRRVSPDAHTRPVADPIDDWNEEELLVPADRVRDTTPRWRERASRVGYGRPNSL